MSKGSFHLSPPPSSFLVWLQYLRTPPQPRFELDDGIENTPQKGDNVQTRLELTQLSFCSAGREVTRLAKRAAKTIDSKNA